MSKIRIDFSKEKGKIKPMHCVNNGPLKEGEDARVGNFDKCVKGTETGRQGDGSLVS